MERFKLKDPLKQRKSTKDIAGFVNGNGCYICDTYAPAKDNKGENKYYHVTRIFDGIKVTTKMHRYVYETYNNCKISDGLLIRHKCDNVLCINPDHLELGTYQDNSDDMVERKRSASGEKNPSSKLSNEQAEEIRVLLSKKEVTQTQIAKMYNVSCATITHIKKGNTRTNVR